ncbi:MAG: citrate lyase [Candidatus Tectimicrobiota bacterium]|nr:MAG: citrate lyase [Candidatus Tectomicrobia bacterium]
MPVLRSLLFVPGNQPRMLEKALGVRPDALVPDMEDSVPWEEKAQARAVVASYLPRLAAAGPLLIPRVNALDTGLLEDDLAAVVGPHIYGVSVGKIRTPQDIAHLDALLARLEARAGLPLGQVKLLPWIETALAIVHCYQILTASPRIVGAAFGAEDLTHDLGIARCEDDSEVAVPRGLVCVAACAAGVLALDTPYFRFRDPEGLRQNALAAKKIGFKGKFAIHPAQIDILNEVFSPSPEEIAYARRVVAAFEEARRAGRGATSLDGKVIDVPVARRAQALLEIAARLEQSQTP